MKKQKKIKVNKVDNVKKKLIEIPDDIKVLYGKFYIFTGVMFIFLLLYPFLIMPDINMITNIGILLMMPIFYIIMVVEVLKKRMTYRSLLFVLWVVLFFVTYVVSLVKFIIFTWKLVLF